MAGCRATICRYKWRWIWERTAESADDRMRSQARRTSPSGTPIRRRFCHPDPGTGSFPAPFREAEEKDRKREQDRREGARKGSQVDVIYITISP
ncbi:hypothetical protein GCM10022295_62500 [Streptomyces osmaniensis]|uniref:Uncharacterized protein n=1 Tax=Streptomyces osmaniensis TaxID=593134 RepID=A0ABP6XV22_9ACTN